MFVAITGTTPTDFLLLASTDVQFVGEMCWELCPDGDVVHIGDWDMKIVYIGAIAEVIEKYILRGSSSGDKFLRLSYSSLSRTILQRWSNTSFKGRNSFEPGIRSVMNYPLPVSTSLASAPNLSASDLLWHQA